MKMKTKTKTNAKALVVCNKAIAKAHATYDAEMLPATNALDEALAARDKAWAACNKAKTEYVEANVCATAARDYAIEQAQAAYKAAIAHEQQN